MGRREQDYDSLLFGAPMLVRFSLYLGKEFLRVKARSGPSFPKPSSSNDCLKAGAHPRGTRDLAILVGTDFNDGIRDRTEEALKLVQQHGAN